MNTAAPLLRFFAPAIAIGMLCGCVSTASAPRIDVEFEAGAPVISNGKNFVEDTKSKSAFSKADVAEQIAFINQTLAETEVASISPKTSNAMNRRYSVFLKERANIDELESVLYRLSVSPLVASAMWTEPNTAMAKMKQDKVSRASETENKK